ncbi:MAG: hypothetical protein A2289_21230 [Deltaproteobacteria bacterium RIFOXYA12_FULL_58_15]|nr:MAG: hypothetical protein A2289_21230 [Deltaproteobacteria bacterium RIFOXYA12_FULL_58_15]
MLFVARENFCAPMQALVVLGVNMRMCLMKIHVDHSVPFCKQLGLLMLLRLFGGLAVCSSGFFWVSSCKNSDAIDRLPSNADVDAAADSDNGGGGDSNIELLTGAACTDDDQCIGGNLAVCLDNATFLLLAGKEVEIPDGYCSRLGCVTNVGEDECGHGGYCFDLQQFLNRPLGACLKLCVTTDDCRNGYECMDGAGGRYDPLPFKACLSPALACLLSIPHPSCLAPDGGDGGGRDGGDPAPGDPLVDE